MVTNFRGIFFVFAMKLVQLVLLVLAIMVVLLFCKHSVVEGFTGSEDSIFVSVASFRDVECSRTLADMFAKASRPKRVFAGVCEQNKLAEEACVAPEFRGQLRHITLPHTQAKGPTYARYLCSTLYRHETYFMQIDSHTKFEPGWDDKLVAMLARCPSDKAILTHYPAGLGH